VGADEEHAVTSEIISIQEMRAIDAASARDGVGVDILMENAGAAVAGAIVSRFAPCPIAVLCGPGANGGDGWVAARMLRDAGWPVWVETLVPREHLEGPTAEAAQAFRGRVSTLRTAESGAELYVDALFGAGLSRPLDGDVAALAERLPRERVIAVDVPSGLHGDLGRPFGDACFSAVLTVTFVRKKAAHVLTPGRMLCGEVVVADIGAPESALSEISGKLLENGPDLWRLPQPAWDAHKHARGHVMAASGGQARTGAVRLAARAALRAGAGLVTVLSPSDALAENAAHLTAIMVRETETAAALCVALSDARSAVVGPAFGLADVHRERLAAILDLPQRPALVLDADALTLLSPLDRKLEAGDVITPHRGEFERLFPGLYERALTRIEAARVAAEKAGCVVLLKGPDTVIAAPDGRAIVNLKASPYLATAGAGDVLAGVVAALMAQGMPPLEAAAAGAWVHGAAGEALGIGLIAEDLVEVLPKILAELTTPP
jgi:hydroxyethylthiazole kinase-like uncharacterized protein yjeF